MTSLTIPEALRLVPEFDRNNAQLHQFLNACETVLTLIAEKYKVNFYKVLRLKLKDKAYDIIKYEELKEFKDLKTKLIAQFIETRSLETIQVELVTAKQHQFESDVEYSIRVERLLSDLNSACISSGTAENISKPIRDLNARRALRAYQEGLREPLKLLVKASRYTTLKSAIDAAIFEGKQCPINIEIKQRTKTQNLTKSCSHCHRSGHTLEECRIVYNSGIP